MAEPRNAGRWQFWIDRGGTFTDIVARQPDGSIATHKLLSENPGRYRDAALAGIRKILNLNEGQPISAGALAPGEKGTPVAPHPPPPRQGEGPRPVVHPRLPRAARPRLPHPPPRLRRR